MQGGGRPAHVALLAAAAFLAVLAVVNWLIGRYGSDAPLWDPWDYEAAGVYIPLIDGTLTLQHLTALHNEHRLFWTRLLALAEFRFLGAWDPLLQLALGAVFDAALAALLVCVVARALSPVLSVVFAAAAAVVFGFPFGWENTLGTWGAQFYLVLLFGVLCTYSIARARAFDSVWWGAIALGVCAYLCMASGILLFFSGAALVAAQLAAGRRSGVRECAALGVLLVIGGALSVDIPALDHHRELNAGLSLTFVAAFAQAAAWPALVEAGFSYVPIHLLLAACLYAPAVVLLTRLTRSGAALTRPEWIFVGLAVWALLHAAALALGRGVSPMNLSRYTDGYSLGLIANLACALTLWPARKEGAQRMRGFVCAWALVFTLALAVQAKRTPPALHRSVEIQTTQRETLKQYLATNDYTALANRAAEDRPYPLAERLKAYLDRSAIRDALPPSLFEPNAPPRSRFSFVNAWLRITPVLFALLSMVLFVISVVMMRRRPQDATASA